MGNKLLDQATSRQNPYNSIGICYVQRTKEGKRNKYWYTPFDEQMYLKGKEEADDDAACSSDHSGISFYLNDPEV